VAEVAAKFRQQPNGAVLPIGNETLRRRIQKNKDQQIALTIPIQPSGKEICGSLVPGTGIPQPVQPIGRMLDGPHRIHQRGRRIAHVRRRTIRIALAGQVKEIGTLRARQHHRAGQARQRLRRGFHIAPLFDPSAPGGADAGACRQFFTPQARRAAANCAPFGRQFFAVGPHEIAQQPPLIRSRHGTLYTRITCYLVLG